MTPTRSAFRFHARTNYDDLRDPGLTSPKILVLLRVPELCSDWFVHGEPEVVMRHSAYWLSLRGAPAVSNRHTVSVRVPRANALTPQTLSSMMNRVGKGGWP
ncbi:MAG: DUF4365 domain-containing protein [Dehalococcoidia bacterium]